MASADGPAHLVSKSSTVPAQPESRAGDPPALYARAEACDKQWAQQMSSNTAHRMSVLQTAQTAHGGVCTAYLYLSWQPLKFGPAKVIVISLRIAALSKVAAPSREARRSRNFAGDGGGHEHSGGGFEAAAPLSSATRATRPRQIE